MNSICTIGSLLNTSNKITTTISPTGNTSTYANSSLFLSSKPYGSVSSLGSGLSGATQWTIETWLYNSWLPSSDYETLEIFSTGLSPTYSTLNLGIRYLTTVGTSPYLQIWLGDGVNGYGNIIGDVVLTNNANVALRTIGWHHYAVTYSSSSGYKIWQDGVNVYANSTTTSISSSLTNLKWGCWAYQSGSSSIGFASNCYIGMTRISNTVVYTSTFTPNPNYGVDPNTFYFFPFTGANGSTSYTANVYSGTSTASFSTANSYISTGNWPTYTTSSMFFNGPYPQFIANTLGSGMTGATQWTIETWMYFPQLPDTGTVYTIFCNEPTPTYSTYVFGAYNTGTATFPTLWVGDGTTSHINIINMLSGSVALTTGWHHFALTYNSASGYKIWQDGTNVATSATTTSISSSITSFAMGNYRSSTSASYGNYAANCYVSMMRISNTAVYTATNTPNTTYGVTSNTFYFFPFTGGNGNTTFGGQVYYTRGTSTAVVTSANCSIATDNYPRTTTTSPTSWSTSGAAVISSTYSKTNMSNNASLYLPNGTQPNRANMLTFPSSKLSGSWTMEWFVYVPPGWSSAAASASEAAIQTFGNSYPNLWVYTYMSSVNSSTLWYVANSWPTGWIFQGIVGQYTASAWNHYALTYNSGNNQYACYINGAYANTVALSTNVSPNIGPSLTNYYFGCRAYNGGTYDLGSCGLYVDAFRVSSNVRYTGSSYTVPSTAYKIDANTVYINYFELGASSTTMTTAEYYYG